MSLPTNGATRFGRRIEEDAEELSLVSTQMLRKILAGDETDPDADPDAGDDPGGGFDPYNSG